MMAEVWQFISRFFLHLDAELTAAADSYGMWLYPLLFLVIFMETGLVFTPFLPGDSLLFAAGALAARPSSPLNVLVLFVLLFVAAVLGDSVNYWIGRSFGKLLIARYPRLIKQEHLDHTHAFFEKYGGKTIVIARFVPIVRTFAPFVAGLGAMTYRKFSMYNVTGAFLWMVVCLGAGFFFGNLEFVKKHFSLVVLAIIFISILPALFGYLSARAEAKRKKPVPLPEDAVQ